MKFLHLADLHLGKQMNDLSLLADQEAVLEQIVSISQSEQIDEWIDEAEEMHMILDD